MQRFKLIFIFFQILNIFLLKYLKIHIFGHNGCTLSNVVSKYPVNREEEDSAIDFDQYHRLTLFYRKEIIGRSFASI